MRAISSKAQRHAAHALHGGADDLQWAQVLFNLEPQGKIPEGTSITFQLRAANLKADLEATPWVAVENNAPVGPVAARAIGGTMGT